MAAPPNKLSPADRWHGDRAREDDQAIWPITSDNTQHSLDAQADMCSGSSGCHRSLPAPSLAGLRMGDSGIMSEQCFYDGRTFLGVVRERSDGSFVVAIGEELLGPFDTARQAVDAVLELARPGGER